MGKYRRLYIIIILALVASSCTTIGTLTEPETKNKIYSGTIRQAELKCAHGTCIDFPFSFAADTLLLPVTIPWTLVNHSKSSSGGETDANKKSVSPDNAHFQ